MPQYALLDVWDQGIPVLPYSFFLYVSWYLHQSYISLEVPCRSMSSLHPVYHENYFSKLCIKLIVGLCLTRNRKQSKQKIVFLIKIKNKIMFNSAFFACHYFVRNCENYVSKYKLFIHQCFPVCWAQGPHQKYILKSYVDTQVTLNTLISWFMCVLLGLEL